MKKILSVIGLILLTTQIDYAQDSIPTIAVYQPKVTGLYSTNGIVAEKMLRIEIAKLQKYLMYDEFDMKEAIEKDTTYGAVCLSKNCLTRLGRDLGVDYIISGSYDKLKNRIVIFLKLINVKKDAIVESCMIEFDSQESELQRMTEVALKEMHHIDTDKNPSAVLKYDKAPVTNGSLSSINNSGPRIGYGFFTGELQEFALRSERRGGLDIVPGGTMIGYQLETQYVGSENFSALIEGVVNVTGLEQGIAIPSIAILNGFRFGKGGWEIAFGPGFGVKKTSNGFFDSDGTFGAAGTYFSESDWNAYANATYSNDPQFQVNGSFQIPDPSVFNGNYNFDRKYLDSRGTTRLNTTFIFAFGRTFRAGSLNIPVNVFYSAQRKSAITGINIGFNVMKSRRTRRLR